MLTSSLAAESRRVTADAGVELLVVGIASRWADLLSHCVSGTPADVTEALRHLHRELQLVDCVRKHLLGLARFLLDYGDLGDPRTTLLLSICDCLTERLDRRTRRIVEEMRSRRASRELKKSVGL